MPRIAKLAVGFIAVTVLTLTVAAGAGIAFREAISQRVAVYFLTRLGISSPNLTVTHITTNHLRIEHLALGLRRDAQGAAMPAVSVASANISFRLSWRDGPRVSVHTVALHSPRLAADVRDGNVQIVGLPILTAPSDGRQFAVSVDLLPRTVTVTDLNISVATSEGPVSVSGAVSALQSSSGGFEISGSVDLKHQNGHVAGPIKLAISRQLDADLSAKFIARTGNGGPTTFSITAQGKVTLPPKNLRAKITATWGDDATARPPWPGLPKRFDGRAEVDLDELGNGQVSVQAAIGRAELPGAAFDRGEIFLSGRVIWDGSQLAFTPTQGNRIELYGLKIDAAPNLSGPVKLRLREPIALSWKHAKPNGLAIDFSLPLDQLSARLIRDDLDLPIVADGLRIDGMWQANGAGQPQWSASISAANVASKGPVKITGAGTVGNLDAVLADLRLDLSSAISQPIPLLVAIETEAEVHFVHLAPRARTSPYPERLTMAAHLSVAPGTDGLPRSAVVVADMTATGISGDNFTIDTATGQIAGDLQIGSNGIAFFPAAKSAFALHIKDLPAGITAKHPIRTTFDRGSDPAFDLQWPKAADDPIIGSARLVQLSGQFAREDREISTKVGRVSAKGQWSPITGRWAGTVRLSGGQANVQPDAIEASQISGQIRLRGGGKTKPRGTIKITSARITDRVDPPRIAPVDLDGEVTLSRSKVEFAVNGASDAASIFQLAGHHDLDRGTGGAKIVTPDLSFGESALNAAKIFPVLSAVMTSASGQAAATAQAQWGPRGFETGGRLVISNGRAHTALAQLTDVNADITFDNLWPPSTPPGQTVRIGVVNAGVPITDVDIRFRLQPDRALHMETLSWPMFGGRMRLADAIIHPDAESWALSLHAEDLDLQAASDQLNYDDLTATGRMSGDIPVQIVGDKLFIKGAVFRAATSGGVIQYTGEAGRSALSGVGEQATLLLDALQDFNYTEFTLTADGPATGNMTFGVSLKGANPAVLDGYPFELNLNVEGSPMQLLRSGSTLYDLPDAVREKLGQD